jgi:hypothetical protein
MFTPAVRTPTGFASACELGTAAWRALAHRPTARLRSRLASWLPLPSHFAVVLLCDFPGQVTLSGGMDSCTHGLVPAEASGVFNSVNPGHSHSGSGWGVHFSICCLSYCKNSRREENSVRGFKLEQSKMKCRAQCQWLRPEFLAT